MLAQRILLYTSTLGCKKLCFCHTSGDAAQSYTQHYLIQWTSAVMLSSGTTDQHSAQSSTLLSATIKAGPTLREGQHSANSQVTYGPQANKQLYEA